MNILALDTSGPACSVAVVRGGRLAYEARAVNKLTHSRSLMPMVEEALHKAGLSVRDVNLIAAVTGPGSFTGVRLGVGAAQGMARGLGVRCVGVNALEAMARSLFMMDKVICPIRDARGGQVYGAAFLNGERLMPDAAAPLAGYLDAVAGFEGELVFLGDGVDPLRERIIEHMVTRALFAPAHLLLPGAASAACIALEHQKEAVEPGALLPVYLRAPQAERERMRKGE